jgi:thiol-disulfide isomerase/thioredoxin
VREREAASRRRSRRRTVGALGTLLGATIIIAVGFVVLRPGAAPVAGDTGTASGGSVTVGTGVGQRAPDFRLVDVDGRTVTTDALRGKPTLLWFTTSYCTPCQDGALALGRVLDRIGPASRQIAVVMVFVDPGEPPASLVDWKARFGRPDWEVAPAAGSIVRDYRVQYLDTKYLLDADGVIRVVDYLPLEEANWERDLRVVLGG